MKTIMILVVLLLITTVVAKEPKVGDLVTVQAGNTEYEGKITGIGNGIMCIAARITPALNGSYICRDYCIGIGQIEKMWWVNQTGHIEK